MVLFDYGNDVHANNKQPISQEQLSSALESTFHGFGGRPMRIAVAEVIHGALLCSEAINSLRPNDVYMCR